MARNKREAMAQARGNGHWMTIWRRVPAVSAPMQISTCARCRLHMIWHLHPVIGTQIVEGPVLAVRCGTTKEEDNGV